MDRVQVVNKWKMAESRTMWRGWQGVPPIKGLCYLNWARFFHQNEMTINVDGQGHQMNQFGSASYNNRQAHYTHTLLLGKTHLVYELGLIGLSFKLQWTLSRTLASAISPLNGIHSNVLSIGNSYQINLFVKQQIKLIAGRHVICHIWSMVVVLFIFLLYCR